DEPGGAAPVGVICISIWRSSVPSISPPCSSSSARETLTPRKKQQAAASNAVVINFGYVFIFELLFPGLKFFYFTVNSIKLQFRKSKNLFAPLVIRVLKCFS